MEKAKVGLGRKLLALFVLLALATFLLPNATSAYADEDATVVGTYTVVANLSVPASYIPLGMTAYLTNANNPIDGTGTPTTPTEEATATLTEYSDGTYTLVVQVVNQVFTLQTMGSTSTHATAEVTGTSSDLVFASGVSFDGAPETRISEVTFTISEYVEDGYVFEGCGLYATALNYTISDAPVTLTFELPDDEEEEEEAHTHSYVESSWSWSDDYSTATLTLTCTGCGDEQTPDVTVSVETVETSCTVDGSSTYIATATYDDTEYSDVQTVEGDSATGHSYAASEWTWADDGVSATLTFACANCGDEVSYDATVTSVVTTEATETEDGVLTCAAVVEVDGVEYSDTATFTIAATGSDDDADDDADADADDDADDDADAEADADDDADEDADADDDADAADADDDALAQTGDNVAGAAGAAACAALAALALGGAALRRRAGEREEI